MNLRVFSTTPATASILAVALVLAAGGAHAQKRPQYLDDIYVSGQAGMHKTERSDADRNGRSSAIQFDPGFAGTAAIGYGFGNGLRAEFELGHRIGTVKSVNGGAGGGGKLNATSAMANVLYDFAGSSAFVPYLGAGFGGVRMAAKSIGPDTGGASIDGNKPALAYQGIAGINYQLDENFSIGAAYRYFMAQTPSINTNVGDTAKLPYRDHSIMIGMSWAFLSATTPAALQVPAAAAPRMAAPAPAPQAPQQAAVAGPRAFTVFFDFDKSAITPAADRVLVQAAESAKAGMFTRIQATGHTDTVGTPRYNMALSIRRANAVRDVLVREGIPATQIVVVGRGETQLLVPTPDNVNEARNRRVEIVIE
jgi:outer membrane protein OmpA-like peptidoglycan-associated protein